VVPELEKLERYMEIGLNKSEFKEITQRVIEESEKMLRLISADEILA
jgi:hypothetical protein